MTTCREEERGENSGEKILDLISMKYKKNKQNADDSTQRRGGGGGDTGGEEEEEVEDEEKIKKISLFLKSEVWSEKFMCRREKSPGHTCTRLRGAAGGARWPRNLCAGIQTFNRSEALAQTCLLHPLPSHT